MLRRLATLLCIGFMLALFLPLLPSRPDPVRAAPSIHTQSLIRLAPIVVSDRFAFTRNPDWHLGADRRVSRRVVHLTSGFRWAIRQRRRLR
jgi:hypothetical protein